MIRDSSSSVVVAPAPDHDDPDLAVAAVEDNNRRKGKRNGDGIMKASDTELAVGNKGSSTPTEEGEITEEQEAAERLSEIR